MGKKLKDLYDLLIEQELTDKTFKEFKAAIEDQPYRDKVYEVLSQRKLYQRLHCMATSISYSPVSSQFEEAI